MKKYIIYTTTILKSFIVGAIAATIFMSFETGCKKHNDPAPATTSTTSGTTGSTTSTSSGTTGSTTSTSVGGATGTTDGGSTSGSSTGNGGTTATSSTGGSTH